MSPRAAASSHSASRRWLLAAPLAAAAFAAAKDGPVLVYCGDGVAIGPEATSILNAAGYARAVNFKPGIEGRAGAGLPIAKG